MATETEHTRIDHFEELIRAAQSNSTSVIGGPLLRHGLAFTKTHVEVPGEVLAELKSIQPNTYQRVVGTLAVARRLHGQLQLRP